MERRVFGPVPSRRLGRSLGVNNIPPKHCSYSCLYCQVGKAIKMQTERQEFYKPEELVKEVRETLGKLGDTGEYPDYITIVPDGEPTLDINLGKLITLLRTTGIPVAVITNASLISSPDVQQDLFRSDYLSVKCDVFDEDRWHVLNKPHKALDLQVITEGISSFAKQYRGKMVTETMLIKGINDTEAILNNTARQIASFNPDTAYIAIPTRPPAFRDVFPADEQEVNLAYHIFSSQIEGVELLTGYEGNAFSSTGNFRDEILSITSVHPMREDAVKELISRTGEESRAADRLVEEELLIKIPFANNNYYLRKFNR